MSVQSGSSVKETNLVAAHCLIPASSSSSNNTNNNNNNNNYNNSFCIQPYSAHFKIKKILTLHHSLIFNKMRTRIQLIIKCEQGS